jgi:signal transduction histidine kinase
LIDAIQHFSESDFDIVLIDIGQSDNSALDRFVVLLYANPDTPFVVLADADFKQRALKALRWGAMDYVLKSDLPGRALSKSLRYAIERYKRAEAENKLLRVQEQEQRRVARGLHDGVIQSLSCIRLRLKLLADSPPTEADLLQQHFRQLSDQASAAITEVRRVARDLYPVVLEKKRLGDAIKWYARKLQSELGLQMVVDVDCPEQLAATTKQHLFRIFQECVGNIVRHANANVVKIVLRADHKRITLEIVDDGQGFDIRDVESSTNESLGLVSMRERVKLLDGFVQIRSELNLGTTVFVGVPTRLRGGA